MLPYLVITVNDPAGPSWLAKNHYFRFSVEHVKHVAELDETRDLKLAPDLKLSDVEMGHFQKMKVSNAMLVFGNSKASAITSIVENNMNHLHG